MPTIFRAAACIGPRRGHARGLQHWGCRGVRSIFERNGRIRLLVCAVWFGGTGRPAFGVVGVNAGYPFTYYNTCSGPSTRRRRGPQRRPLHQHRYDPSYTAIDGRHTTQACANSSLAVNERRPAGGVGRWMQRGPARLAYASSQSARHRPRGGSTSRPPTAVIERRVPQRYTIQGLLDTLRRSTTAPIGIYSTSYQLERDHGRIPARRGCELGGHGQRTVKRARVTAGRRGSPRAGLAGAVRDEHRQRLRLLAPEHKKKGPARCRPSCFPEGI